MVYTVVFSREAKKSIDKLGEIEKRRIKDKISELMVDPYKAGKPLMGLFKVRNIRSSRIEAIDFSTPFLRTNEQYWWLELTGEDAFIEFSNPKSYIWKSKMSFYML